MAKYEIMLIVSGSLEEKAADKVADEILSSLKKTKVETTKYGSKQLAYVIKKDTHGYYYQYNFETDEVPLINEFRRLCLINKNVLRHLIINCEKDYGYRASINEKKIKAAENQARIYQEKKAQFEKAREARMNEMNAAMSAAEVAESAEAPVEVATDGEKRTVKSTTTKTTTSKTTTKKAPTKKTTKQE